MTQQTRRERQRQMTMQEIVAAARALLITPGGLSLRSVAHEVGMTAPALYRYVDNVAELSDLVAQAIDADTAQLLRDARDAHPADDPAAQIVAAGLAFRTWALSHRAEFSLVFANPHVPLHDHPHAHDQEVSQVFHDLLLRVWEHYHFPIPTLEELDPSVLATFDDATLGFDLSQIDPSQRGMVWVFLQSWVALYGTVTLEVFGHCHPALIGSGALFREMLLRQAERLGFAHEVPRLLDQFADQLAT